MGQQTLVGDAWEGRIRENEYKFGKRVFCPLLLFEFSIRKMFCYVILFTCVSKT